jgi:Glycosyltransferase family 87
MVGIGLITPVHQSSSPVSAIAGSAFTSEVKLPRVRRAFGYLGLLGVLASTLFVASGSARHPGIYVPASSGGWPKWLAGPLGNLGVGISSSRFQTLTLILCASYLVVLLCVRALPGVTIAATILLAHLILLLGPPLLSQDVFGYIGFARLGALHGLDPYTHFAPQATGDPVFPFIGWHFQHSPYGPLFTLGSYAITPLGIAGDLWTLKVLAVLSSLCAVVLVARAAAKEQRSPLAAAAFVGLNPVLLELAVGGAHNDTLLLLALAGALVLTAGANPRLRAGALALVMGVGIKVTAGLALPFLVLAGADFRQRSRIVVSASLAMLALVCLALIGFGSHALGFLSAISEQQQLVATHSIPAETARLAGLRGTPAWWRHIFVFAFVAVLAAALWRTARGADWRTCAGWSTLALLICTAWLLPWYAIWALPLAALSPSRNLRIATLLLCAYAISIHLPLADPLLSPR